MKRLISASVLALAVSATVLAGDINTPGTASKSFLDWVLSILG